MKENFMVTKETKEQWEINPNGVVLRGIIWIVAVLFLVIAVVVFYLTEYTKTYEILVDVVIISLSLFAGINLAVRRKKND